MTSGHHQVLHEDNRPPDNIDANALPSETLQTINMRFTVQPAQLGKSTKVSYLIGSNNHFSCNNPFNAKLSHSNHTTYTYKSEIHSLTDQPPKA